MTRALATAFLCCSTTALAAEPKLEGELGIAPTSWDACEGVSGQGHYLLGRYAHNAAVVEVSRTSSPVVAKLWAHAKPGGVAVSWPGGRPGVRHIEGKGDAATSVASAGRLYVWEATNGWGGNLGQVTGVELAKSLCDASTIVVYVTLHVDLPGEGYLVASVFPPEQDPDLLAPASLEPSKEVMTLLYAEMLSRLGKGLRAQKLAPAELNLSLLPGRFVGTEPGYVVSMKWGNTFDDRYSIVCLADKNGKITQVIDNQEGGSAGMAVEVADLGLSKTQDLIYELTTLDGSAAALWAFMDGKVVPLVQTTPVGE